jgi:TolB-like protein/Tfp pilus assembly protein PilF
LRLLAELKRRNVIRMAGLYLVGAWLITQVAGTVLPMFGAPEWVARSVVVLLAIGFIPAIVFSWLYELTPDGLKRDGEVTPEQSIAAHTARRMDRLIFAGLLALIAVIAADRYWPRANPPAAPESAEAGAAATPPLANGLDDRPPPSAPSTIAPNTIAVLPFVDLSPEGDQAWFADGISEEVLNVLVGVDGLTVASRTSSFQFRAQEAIGIPAIAGLLKVRHVLEGSVRKAGDRIRITAQLIDSTQDKHLWSETFDRTLSTENLFDIQDEIASAIVAAIGNNLDVQIGVAAPAPQRTANLDAYGLYLQARPSYYARENLPQIAELLDRAIEIDPDFVDAIALRASVAMLSSDYDGQTGGSSASAHELARQLATQALALRPGHGLALGVLTNLDSRDNAEGGDARRSVADVTQGFDAALAADPRNPDLLNWRGRWLAYVGRFADAEADFRRCREADPAHAPCRINLAGVLTVLGRREEAHQALVDAAAEGALVAQAVVLLVLHALDMREAFYLMGSANPRLRGWHDFPALYDALGQPDADHSILRSRLEALRERSAGSFRSGDIGDLLAALGDPREPLSAWFNWLPTLAQQRQSAVFRASVINSGRLRYWQEHGFPAQCRAVGTDDFACD